MEQFNIYHRRDGRYEGRISRGKRKNGKRRFQYFFGHSRKEVQDKMTAVRRQEFSDNCSKTVRQIFSEWFHSVRHRVKESTAANYRMKAEKHVLPAFSNMRADEITESDIYSFIESRQKSGLSNRYISDILIMMKSVYKYKTSLICNGILDTYGDCFVITANGDLTVTIGSGSLSLQMNYLPFLIYMTVSILFI